MLPAERVWKLRRTITAYDAWYVALAESLDAPLLTLYHRLARAPGPRCSFELPPDTSTLGTAMGSGAAPRTGLRRAVTLPGGLPHVRW
ncbi:MAG: type II toxin-antitoxin system VapC family toxin [Egibacteraceae bacterium]